MKAGRILSIGFLSLLAFACDQGTQPAPASQGQVDGRRISPAVNALTKTAALQAGYGMSREAAVEGDSADAFDSALVDAFQKIGICQNFIDMVTEVIHAGSENAQQTLLASPRFQRVVSCFETEAQSLQGTEDINLIFGVFDKCFCEGSGSVFGAIAAYAWKNYSAPQLNGYTAPKLGTYKSPDLPGYQAPSLPGYKAPSIP